MPLQLTGAPSDPDLIRLPWDVPLEEWPEHHLVSLPRGISRHVVRFARLSGKVYAIKEISEYYAKREYRLLWDLSRMDTPRSSRWPWSPGEPTRTASRSTPRSSPSICSSPCPTGRSCRAHSGRRRSTG
ncbi:hypothetical protein ACFQX6_56465 [Streptosporangium lutulentum]